MVLDKEEKLRPFLFACMSLSVLVSFLIEGLSFSGEFLILFVVLLLFATISDIIGASLPNPEIRISASFVAISAGTILIGPLAGVLLGLGTIFFSYLYKPYKKNNLLVNLAIYSFFPLLIYGLFSFYYLFDLESTYYLLIITASFIGIIVNYLLISLHTIYLEESSWEDINKSTFLPFLPYDFFSSVLVGLAVFIFNEYGLAACGVVAFLLLGTQVLISYLLVFQSRAKEIEKRVDELSHFQVGLLASLLQALDIRDKMTARHSAACAVYSKALAKEYGLSDKEQDLAHTAGLLHDIGKFVLPDHILKGEKKLSEEDWKKVKTHPYQGARILSRVDGYGPVSDIIVAHHERWDGRGYPRRLEENEIPLLARIITISDAYDVMTARDSYKAPLSKKDALEELRNKAGIQFDPELVEVFCSLIEKEAVDYNPEGMSRDDLFEKELHLKEKADHLKERKKEDC